VDLHRAKSLIKASEDAIKSVGELSMKNYNFSTIIRELYEALRQCCESIGYTKGYKFVSHEAIIHFLKEVLNEERLSLSFDYYRKLRVGVNYYGKDISKETVEKALKEVPLMVSRLKEMVNI